MMPYADISGLLLNFVEDIDPGSIHRSHSVDTCVLGTADSLQAPEVAELVHAMARRFPDLTADRPRKGFKYDIHSRMFRWKITSQNVFSAYLDANLGGVAIWLSNQVHTKLVTRIVHAVMTDGSARARSARIQGP